MNFIKLLLCFTFVLALESHQVAAANPGLILRTTQNAVNYGLNVTVQVLSQLLNGYTIIPDKSGSFGIGSFIISNINVRQFNQPIQKTSLIFQPPSGLSFQASEIMAQLAADYNITIRVPFIGDFNTRGQFSITASDISFFLDAAFLLDPAGSGHIIAQEQSCTAHVGSIAFHFAPGLDSILQALAVVIKPIINVGLNQGLCRAMGAIVNTVVNPLLTGVPLTQSMPINFNSSLGLPPMSFSVDYSFLASPVVGINYAQAQLKGQVYAPGHQYDMGQPTAPTVNSLSDPPPYPLTNSMVVFQLSDYIINTFGFASTVSGYTSINITSASLTALGTNPAFLQTCCPANSSSCVGGIIQSICTMFPHGAVEVQLSAAAPPYGHTTTQGTTITVLSYANFYVRLPNGTASSLFRASTSTSEIVSNIRINNYKVSADITTVNPLLNMLSTNIGPVNANQLQTAWNQAVSGTWDSLLNSVVSSGVSLPPLPCFNIQNGHFRSDLNNVQAGVDIIFVGIQNCPYIPHLKKLLHDKNKEMLQAAL